jgi:predicted CopG family antitoxin
MKQDIQIHVKHDTYVKLSELKARLRKRSFDEVIKELIKTFEMSRREGV